MAYEECNDEYYRGYNYVTSRNWLHEIMKMEPNDLYKLMRSVYINNPVDRTNHYPKILINEKHNRITY